MGILERRIATYVLSDDQSGLRADTRRNRNRILHTAAQHFASHGIGAPRVRSPALAAAEQARSIAISSRTRGPACHRLQGKQVDARFFGRLFPASLILRAPLF